MMALASLAQPNMNGPYVYSTTPGGTPGKLPAQYADWPGGVESPVIPWIKSVEPGFCGRWCS